MRYEVYQSYETLGDPSREEFSSQQEAEEYADKLRIEIVQMIQKNWTIEPKSSYFGGSEAEAWEEAGRMSGGIVGHKFSAEAAEYIAQQAVVIDGIEEED